MLFATEPLNGMGNANQLASHGVHVVRVSDYLTGYR